ncbi:MAG: hypothetical protein Q9160_001384 [Pyrenula sp. 1 TL-2023]
MAQQADSLSAYNIHSTDIQSSPGVSLSQQQKLLVGSVLDLFLGKPTKRKLTLWDENAAFEDPITTAAGRKKYEAQWYGLAKAFSEIEQLSHKVTDAGNPIKMDMKTRYKIAGIGKEQVIESKIIIQMDSSGEKISKVEDRWDGNLPDSAFKNAFRRLNAVSVPLMVSVPNSVEEEEGKKE